MSQLQLAASVRRTAGWTSNSEGAPGAMHSAVLRARLGGATWTMNFMVLQPLDDGPQAVTDQTAHFDPRRAFSAFLPAIKGAGRDAEKLGRRLAVEQLVR